MFLDDFAILIVSFDGYSDLWENQIYLLNKFWKDREIKTYLANNTLKPKFENVEILNTGTNLHWSAVIRNALKQINEKNILFLLDDYFIGKEVNDDSVIEVFEIFKKTGMKFYQMNIEGKSLKINSEALSNYPYIKKTPKALEYGISLQPAIWNREFLLDLLGSEDYSAWEFERKQLKNVDYKSSCYIKDCYFDNRNIFNIHNFVIKGYIVRKEFSYFKKHKLLINKFDRELMPLSMTFRKKIYKIIFNFIRNHRMIREFLERKKIHVY